MPEPNRTIKTAKNSEWLMIMDDLDCSCNIKRKILFDHAVNQAENGAFIKTQRIIGFAAPELEAWVIADWENTIAKHIDFRENNKAMQHWLNDNKVPLDTPETFSFYDDNKKSCHEKLSDFLIESSRRKNQTVYSKAKHTPVLLHDSRPDVVIKKCPLFREFFTQLKNLQN